MRCGLIAKKIGMTRVFDENAQEVPVTLLKVENCCVATVRQADKDGYDAVCLTAGVQKAERLNKPQRAVIEKANLTAPQKMYEFRVSPDCVVPVGSELSVSHFVKDQLVDATAVTQGKGFAGGMKRWNFGGLRATHGISLSHRSIGSTGQQGMSKVFKGKKMPGQMGAKQMTIQNLVVHDMDVEQGLLMIKGAVPGHKNSWIRLKDAVKKPLSKDVPMPAGLKAAAQVKEVAKEAAAQEEAGAQE
ncbi:MAG: 50S ribosomal protein L3 [Alphaproteobacteria bacterium]|nr:50S ribosomal protein L3 [Alphaproteobacteria bacterium]MBN2780207.1 50S ribosomal protein L3 [Alphaproteobacteria bacterium]